MTLQEYTFQYVGSKIFILPADLEIELAGPDMILYYWDEQRNQEFLRLIPRDNGLYHFFVKRGDEYIYLGGRYFNNIDIAHRCIIEGHGWKHTLIACEHAQ